MRHLELLNVFLALQFEQPGYPSCLTHCGYLTHSVGVKMRLADGTTVAPDVLVSSPRLAVTLLVEVKGGKHLKADQLDRMLHVTPEDLRDVAHLSIPDPVRHRVHVLYFCNEEDRERFAAAANDKHVSILGFDGARFRISGTALPDPDLEACLASANVAPNAPPLDLVPYDDESSNGDIARVIVTFLIDMWLQGAGRVSAEDIIRRTHHIVDHAMMPTGSGSERTHIARRVRSVLAELAKSELSSWLELSGASPPSWNFLRSAPEPSDRTRELQKLQRAVHGYLERVEGSQLGLPFDEEE